jgi:hypothetical protein
MRRRTSYLRLSSQRTTKSQAKCDTCPALFPGALDDLPCVSPGRRRTPVQYPYPVTLRCTTRAV